MDRSPVAAATAVPNRSHGARSPCDAPTERGGYKVWDTSERRPYHKRFNEMKRSTEQSGLRSMLRAFRHRNFRLFFGGQSISLVGTWVQQIALSWTVYQLTHSSFLLGLVSFAGQLPLFIVTPFAGVWVDRWSRHRTLIATQTLSMLQAFLLAAVVLTGSLQVWNLITLNVLAGLILAFDLTARQAFMVDMVGSGRDLPNAVALNAFIINGGRMLGPAIAGLLLTIVSPAVCFLLNAISYVPVIGALLAMKVAPLKANQRATIPGRLTISAKVFVMPWGFHRSARCCSLSHSLVWWACPTRCSMPIFAAEVLHGGAHTLGILMAAPGIGALDRHRFSGNAQVDRRRRPSRGNRCAHFRGWSYRRRFDASSRTWHSRPSGWWVWE